MIFREDDVQKVVEFLQEFDAEVHIRKVEFTPEDREVLANCME